MVLRGALIVSREEALVHTLWDSDKSPQSKLWSACDISSVDRSELREGQRGATLQ